MNAAGRNLRGSEFVGQDLTGAIFDGCSLDDVRFYQCDLSNASFRHADMAGMQIGDCDTEGADFTDATINGILGTPPLGSCSHDMYLSEEQLMSTRSYKTKDLHRCAIFARWPREGQAIRRVRYDFRNANLAGAMLLRGDFLDCAFDDARIDEFQMEDCKVAFKQLASTKNFQNRSLRQMRFRLVLEGKPDFSGIDLTGTELSSSALLDAEFKDATITECTLSGLAKEQLYSTKSYQHGDLRGITFLQSNMSGWDLSRCNLTACRFSHCYFENATFEDAVITSVHFANHGWMGLTLDQLKSTWNYKNNRMKGIVLPDVVAEALRHE
jgi:uncharacterized protein YjbI with pentapeptide repeats